MRAVVAGLRRCSRHLARTRRRSRRQGPGRGKGGSVGAPGYLAPTATATATSPAGAALVGRTTCLRRLQTRGELRRRLSRLSRKRQPRPPAPARSRSRSRRSTPVPPRQRSSATPNPIGFDLRKLPSLNEAACLCTGRRRQRLRRWVAPPPAPHSSLPSARGWGARHSEGSWASPPLPH